MSKRIRKPIPEAQIAAVMTPKGGWTAEELAKWGVPWPPPKGWKQALVYGRAVPKR